MAALHCGNIDASSLRLPTVLCLLSAADMLKTSPWRPVSGL